MSASGASPTRREVRCPTCGGPAWYDVANPWRPFCSERCRQVDLGAWASESYRVDDSGPQDDDDRAPPHSKGTAH